MTKGTQLATVDTNRLAALRDRAGTSERSNFEWPSALTVNRNPVAEDDTPLPMGKFTTKVNDEQVFLDTTSIIILAKGTQFRRFNKNAYIGSSMIETGHSKPEYKDSIGGTKVGKIVVEGRELNAEEKELNKQISFNFMLLCLADISKATRLDGTRLHNTNEPVWHPVKVEFRSKNAVDKQDELKKLKKRDEATFDFVTNLTKPHKEGIAAGVPFYNYHFERGDATVFTEDVLASIEAAQTLIENENLRIYKLHVAAQSNTVSEDDESLDLPEDTE